RKIDGAIKATLTAGPCPVTAAPFAESWHCGATVTGTFRLKTLLPLDDSGSVTTTPDQYSEGISYDWNAPLHRLTVSATDELRLRRFRLVPSGTEIAGPDVGAHSSITVSDSAIGAVTIDGTKTRPRRRRSPVRVTIDGVRGWVELGESSVVAFAG